MRLLFRSLVLATCASFAWGQSNDCSLATVLSVSANCASPTAGTSTGATQSIPGCTGNADDDVWYQFVASSSSQQIVVTANAGYDPVVQLFSGACASLISLVCKDDFGDGVSETINATGLTAGSTYRLRVYHYLAGSGTGNFTICVTNPPPAPSNNECAGSTLLNVNSTCTFTSATTDGATQSLVGCSGSADDDVWFRFVATNSLQNILVSPVDNIDLVFQVYSGTCGALTSIACIDNTFTAQNEQQNIVGLVAGQTYYVRVFDYYLGTTGDFQICVTGTATPTPTNDDPCTAIQLPTVTSTCNFSSFTTVGATASLSAPTPSSCAGGSGAAIGGFSASSRDIWFSITVPSSGNVDITAQPNAGGITDGVMALYSGTCTALTQIACSDDNAAYPGSANDLLPLISASGLTPGSTVFLRYWGYGSNAGTFGICVSTATNDACANALYICDINGYSASTSASYTPDRPDNMRGNNEDINGVNMPDGVNTGGIFGQGGPWGTGAPFYDVIINNNSWIKFTASSTSATLNVNIYDCWVGNYPSGGLQMQIFEGTNCTNFVPVSNFQESSTGFSITANNLTIGDDYYLMVDGYAGDICNYTITANSGVQFPDIDNVPPICNGQSVTLVAPPGATSYAWQHDGSSGQTVTVTPSTTQTYYCEVSGLCDYKQMLDVTVTVIPNPTVAITQGSATAICEGSSLILNATGATSYIWDIPASGSTVTVSPTGTTSYTVTGTENGCSATASITVSINPNPTLSVNPSATNADCGGSNGALNGAIAVGANPLSYTWTNGSTTVGTSLNLTNIPAGVYYLTVEDGNTCSAQFGPFDIINPGAPPASTILVNDATPCLDSDVLLSATNSVAGATFTWSGPGGFSANTSSITLGNVSSADVGTYCVTASFAGCTGPSTCQSITLSPPPSVDISALGNDTTICENASFELTAGGAVNYVWTGPGGFTSSNPSVLVNNASAINTGLYTVTGTDSNGCSSSADILISFIPTPTIDLNADQSTQTYCGGGIAILTATGASNYIWTGPDNFSDQGANVVILDLAQASEGYYVVVGSDSEGCSASDSLFITVVTNVPASAQGDTSLCPGELLLLTGAGGASYTWSGPQGFYSNEPNPSVPNIDFAQAGWYVLTVVDVNGCLGYDSTFVDISNDAGCLFIPNLITPDFDGKNDLWVINGIEKYENAVVQIYNRWGNMIYEASPYLNNWDGIPNHGASIDGQDDRVPNGTYFYIIDLQVDEHEPFHGYLEVQY